MTQLDDSSREQPADLYVRKAWIGILGIMQVLYSLALWLLAPRFWDMWLLYEANRALYIGFWLWSVIGMAALSKVHSRSPALFNLYIFAIMAIFELPLLLTPFVMPIRDLSR